MEVNATSGQTILSRRSDYDVFISYFRLEVESSLARNILDELTGSGLRVFFNEKDEEMDDLLPNYIQEDIPSASLHIPILSNNYADSPRCLNELSSMLKTGFPIIPIFYNIQPSDLRGIGKHEGIHSQTLAQYRAKGRYNPQSVQEWRKALYSASFLSGRLFDTLDFDDERPLKNIVNTVLKIKENGGSPVASHPVGLDQAMDDFENTIPISSPKTVKIVGIAGVGGCGKTVLAKEYFKRISASFNGSAFLYGVQHSISRDGLHSLQMQLLKYLGVDVKGLTSYNLSESMEAVAPHLRSRRLLIVFDDINDVDQIDAFLPIMKLLGAGSLVILTTRSAQVLDSRGISCIYEMGGLSQSHAQQLFCWHAFGQPRPLYEFEDFVPVFSSICNGNPQSIQMLGEQLYAKSRDYWEKQLVSKSRIFFNDIIKSQRVLVIKGGECYNPTEELLLLRWYDCPHTSLPTWGSLQNLIVLDLINVFFNELWSPNIKPPAQLRKLNIIGSISRLPKSIKHLVHLETIVVDGWLNTSLKALPQEFCYLQSLKHLTLRWCRALTSLPTQFGNLTKLQHLDLSFCSQLSAIPRSFKGLIQLQYLDFQGCRNLEIVPHFLGEITTLEHLSFKDCTELRVFPIQVPCQVHLKSLNLVGTSLQEVPIEVGRLVNLEILELGSPYLTGLPVSVGNMTNLRKLNVEACSRLKCFPDSLSLIKKLTIIKPQQFNEARDEHNSRGKYLFISKKKMNIPANYFKNIVFDALKFKTSYSANT